MKLLKKPGIYLSFVITLLLEGFYYFYTHVQMGLDEPMKPLAIGFAVATPTIFSILMLLGYWLLRDEMFGDREPIAVTYYNVPLSEEDYEAGQNERLMNRIAKHLTDERNKEPLEDDANTGADLQQ